MLDDHVGGHRGAVAQVTDSVRRHLVVVEHPRDPFLDGLGRVLGRRWDLEVMDGAAVLVEHGEIREGSADVDAYSNHDFQTPFIRTLSFPASCRLLDVEAVGREILQAGRPVIIADPRD